MKTPPPGLPSNRREFLQQMMLFGMATSMPLGFFSCAKDIETNYSGSGLAPYKVWEEMLMAVKTSPDFLEGRMQQLIREGEPKAMFDFVRDEIYLMPPAATYLQKMGQTMQYGIRGVLRYGFATPREKAELLHKMYAEAGISSQVVYEQTNFTAEEVPGLFFRPIARKFAPLVDKKTQKRWEKEMQSQPAEASLNPLDTGELESRELAGKLWDLLPEKEKIRPMTFDYRWDNYRSPALELEWQGEKKYAHLFDPTVPFGRLKSEGGKTVAAEEAEFTGETIAISLSIRDGIKMKEEVELLAGSFKLHELAGNQLVLNFAHGLSVEEMLFTPVGNLRRFTPTLSFQSFDENLDYMAERSVIGQTFTLEGDIIDAKSDSAQINGTQLLEKPNADLQKKVQQVSVKAIPGKYPFVKLHVSPTDENNNFVEGLNASDFKISDNGSFVAAMMENNQRTPKIILLYDASLSMPTEYYGEKMAIFVERLETAIRTKYPGANIATSETKSDLYSSLYKASQISADVIVYATDGDNNDTYNPAWENVYKAGPPAIVLNVNNSSKSHVTKTFETMATATSGMVIDAKDQVKTIDSILGYLENTEIPPYVFTFYAAGKEKKHSVKIAMDEARLEAAADFEFSLLPEEDMVLGKQLAGLYLTIKTGKQTVKRVLAGWDPILDAKRKAVHKDFIAVRNTILGGALIGVEGEGPTTANALADILKYKLSTREFGEALLQDKLKEAQAAFEKGGYQYNTLQASLMQPLQNGVTQNSMTFAAGPRIAIFKNRVGVEESKSTISFDYLPTSNYVSLAGDGELAFKTTLQKTAQLALLENALFEESTMGELKDKILVERVSAMQDKWMDSKEFTEAENIFWREKIFRGSPYLKIFDKSASVKSHWQINAQTGELYGVLADGTGGGSNGIEQQLKELNRVMDLYMAIFSAMGVANTAIGIVATYGKTLVKLYAIVTEVIIIMDPSGMEDKVMEALKELACNVNKEIMFMSLGKVGEIMGGIDLLISLMGGNGIPGMGCG